MTVFQRGENRQRGPCAVPKNLRMENLGEIVYNRNTTYF